MVRSINRQARYVAVDVETTGLSPWRGDRVIEIGAVALEGDELMAEFSALIKVPRAIPKSASRIHGITDGMLLVQPPPAEVFPALAAFIRDSILVAHNAPFDMSFIRHEFAQLRLNLTNRHICTLEMSRTHYPHLRNHKLETVYRHLCATHGGGGLFRSGTRSGSPHWKQTHRALDDARMVAAIWLAMEGKGYSKK